MKKTIVLITIALAMAALAFTNFTKPPKTDSGVIRGRPSTLHLLVSNATNPESVTLTNASASLTGSPNVTATDWEGSITLSPGQTKEITLSLSGEALGSYSVTGGISYQENGSNYTNPYSITVEVE